MNATVTSCWTAPLPPGRGHPDGERASQGPKRLAIAGYLGGAAGLSGAAAIAHGLALLGGGSLAAGGAGMAGGMLLVTSASAAVGGVGVGGAAALWSAGHAAALSEIIKLQVSYREVLLRSHLRADQAATVIERLTQQRQELLALILEEKSLNDPGAERIKDLEKTERGYADAIEWLKTQLESTRVQGK